MIDATFQLPDFYNEMINHPHTPDELRRQTENKLLHFKKRYLFALPKTADAKKGLSDQIDAMVNGAVILKVPDELAWTLFLERKDVHTVEAYDYPTLRLFISLFPEHPLTAMLKGYFIYYSIPLELDEDDEESTPPDDPDVGLDIIFVSSAPVCVITFTDATLGCSTSPLQLSHCHPSLS